MFVKVIFVLITSLVFGACGTAVSLEEFKRFQSQVHEFRNQVRELRNTVDDMERDHNLHHLMELLYFSSADHGTGIYETVGDHGNTLKKLSGLGTTFSDLVITIESRESDDHKTCTYVVNVWQAGEMGMRWLRQGQLKPTYPSQLPCDPEEDLRDQKIHFTDPSILFPIYPFFE